MTALLFLTTVQWNSETSKHFRSWQPQKPRTVTWPVPKAFLNTWSVKRLPINQKGDISGTSYSEPFTVIARHNMWYFWNWKATLTSVSLKTGITGWLWAMAWYQACPRTKGSWYFMFWQLESDVSALTTLALGASCTANRMKSAVRLSWLCDRCACVACASLHFLGWAKTSVEHGRKSTKQ